MITSYSVPVIIHPSTGDNPPERGRTIQKNTRPYKNSREKLNHLHMHQGSPLIPSFAHCCAASTVITLLPKETSTPSIQPVRHQHPSSHRVLIHSIHMQTISTLSDLLYSLFVTLQPNLSKTSSREHSLLIPHASTPYKAVGTITHSYRHFFTFIPNPLIAQHTFQRSPHSKLLIRCVLHPFPILFQLPIAPPGTYINPLYLTFRH